MLKKILNGILKEICSNAGHFVNKAVQELLQICAH